MEDVNNKKKRNKKKKNKHNKTTEDDAVSLSNGNNDHNANLTSEIVQNGDAKDNAADVDESLNSHHNNSNGTEKLSISVESEKEQWVQREVVLQETIKQLQTENDTLTRKEEILRKSVKQLQEENDQHLQKQVTLEQTVKELRVANDSVLRKETMLEETVKELRNANDSALQKQAAYKETIEKLKYEKDSQMQKESHLEEKLQRSLDDIVSLSSKGESLEEKIKQLESDKESWTITEDTTKETIGRMNVDMARLQMQVVELEDSRSSLLKENQHLVENISGLRLQLQTIETNSSSANASDELNKIGSEREYLESQIESAYGLVDKLMAENSELVDKVNELSAKIEQQNGAAALPSAVGNNPNPRNADITVVSHSVPESSENMSTSVDKSSEIEPAAGLSFAVEADSGEIVQIPLNDSEPRDLELQTVESHTTEPLPFSDAPLVGAPFRLISFVASYVSGADLVDRNG